MDKLDMGHMVYTPQESSFYGVELIRAIEAGKARSLIFPVVGMRDYVAPLMPWETCVIIAQTSQYKSGTLDFWEATAADQLVAQDRTDECLLHISLEETIEAMAFRQFARYGKQDAGTIARGRVQDWSDLIQSSLTAAEVPIYRIGDSTMNREAIGTLTLSNIERAISKLISGEILGRPMKLAGIFLDYLQALPLDPEVQRAGMEMQRRLQVIQDVYRLQKWPVKFDCPVVYAAQAKQKLSAADHKWQLPAFDDAEESNVVCQRVDKVITQWLPKQTSPVGTQIEHGSISFRVEENLQLMRVAKQRGGLPAGKIFANRIDYVAGTIASDPMFGVTPAARYLDSRQPAKPMFGDDK